MNLRTFDAELPQFLDQTIEVGKALHLILLVDQKVAGTRILLEQHDPLPGIARVGHQMGIELHASGASGPYIFGTKQ